MLCDNTPQDIYDMRTQFKEFELQKLNALRTVIHADAKEYKGFTKQWLTK